MDSVESLIFSAVFKSGEEIETRRRGLVTTFTVADAFKGEYHVFYLVTKDFVKVTPNKEFISLYLRTNRGAFSKNSNIDLLKFSVGDSDPYTEFVNSCLSLFDECAKREVTEETYYRSLEMHKMNYVNAQSITILEESAVILAEGAKIGNKHLSGYSDMRSNITSGFHKLDNLMEKTDRKGIITYGINDNEDEVATGLKVVSSYGIHELDKAMGGIYEGDMVSILAPSKGGKSRFATYILHTALVQQGTNVVMWSIENGYKGWEALIRARHFQYFYNDANTDVTKRRFINSDMIRKNDMSPEVRELELASWTDLKCNLSYGRLTNIDEDFNADTFLEVLDTAVTTTGSKLICVDYLQLISESDSGSSGSRGRIPKNERIGEAYKKSLQFLKKKKVAGIFPAQFKQTAVGGLSKVDDKDLVNAEMRDAAGESYEVIKTPDVNLALYGSVEDMRNGVIKILSVPSRNSAPFEPVIVKCDLGACSFYSGFDEK